MPTMGFLSAAIKSIAANGGITIKPISDAMFAIIPRNTIAYVNCFLLTFKLICTNNVLKSPESSSKPTAVIIMIAIPNGANVVRLVTILENIYCIPSLLNRLNTSNLSPVPG